MLAVVIKRNKFFRPGTWLERTDDGWQRADMVQVGKVIKIRRTYGVILPKETMEPYVCYTLKKGFDFNMRRH